MKTLSPIPPGLDRTEATALTAAAIANVAVLIAGWQVLVDASTAVVGATTALAAVLMAAAFGCLRHRTDISDPPHRTALEHEDADQSSTSTAGPLMEKETSDG